MDFDTSAILLAWLAIAVLAFAMAGLLRQVVLLRSALAGSEAGGLGPGIGAPAPALPGIEYAGRRTVLLFADDKCESCRSILDALAAESEDPSMADVVVLFSGSANGHAVAPERLFVQQSELFDRLAVNVTPFALMVDADSRIVAAEPVGSAAMLDEFRTYGARTEIRST
jgi:hypothetical protein